MPELKAKPIIDIMPIVKEIARIDLYNDAMIELDYEPLGEYGIPGRRYFRKGEETRTHHIHIFQQNNRLDITRHLAVRDYLRTHQDKALAYGELKEKLAAKFPFDNERYCNGKDEFVKSLEHLALTWTRKQNR